MGHLVDLSHPIESGVPGYPGLPAPRVESHISHEASRSAYGGRAEFEITRAFLVGNTGTYLDSPFHRFRDGPDIGALPLESLAGLSGVCVDATLRADGRTADLPPGAARPGAAVLIRTGWDRRRGSGDYWAPGPFLSRAALDALLLAGVALVGVDFWNIDDTADSSRLAHTRLLGAGIPVVEHLAGLHQLPSVGFRFYAVPAPVRGAASFPVRAFADVGPNTSPDPHHEWRDLSAG